jgi:Uma2 family endonuclease
MATATETEKSTRAEVGELRFLIHNVGWDRYEGLLELFGDDGPRMNYSRGNVELMSPLVPHERYSSLIGFLIEAMVEELEIPANALGSTTFRKQAADRGLEPDECYYLGANAGRIDAQRRVDLDVDPPPDLAIEVEITSGLLDKLDLYAGLGVPEIWRFDGEALSILLLQPDRTYQSSGTSRAFTFLPMGEIVRFLGEYEAANETAWRRSFRAWVREVLLPLHRRAIGE